MPCQRCGFLTVRFVRTCAGLNLTSLTLFGCFDQVFFHISGSARMRIAITMTTHNNG